MSTTARSNAVASELSLAIARLIEAMDEGVAWIDSRERVRHWNPAMERLTGFAPSLDRATLAEICETLLRDEPERQRLIEALRCRPPARRKAKTRLGPFAVQGPSGVTRYVEFEILAVAPADGGGALLVAHDESRRVNAQKDLEILLHSSSDGIFVMGRLGQITMFNDACERITGYKREEVLHQAGMCRRIFECQHEQPIPSRICPGHAAFEGGDFVEPTEQILFTRDGRRRWVEASYSPIHGPDGETQHVIVIIRDITERKRLEEQLELSRRLATLGQIVGGLAHEIRNPLGAIRSAADIVANEGRPRSQRREAAEFLKEEAARLDRTVKTLLSLTRPVHCDSRPVDVNSLLEQTLAYYAPQRDEFRIETRLAPEAPKVRASSEALQTVFLNLTLNADQAMCHGGTLTVSTEQADGQVRIQFRDSGPGIDPEVIERVFLPFVTTKKSGMGLGLSLAAHIIEAHRGAIAVENHPEGGACFTVTLPACGEE
ncbi:MAG: PAS domain S-box protein [Candidatus Sumerlaeota bacterium]|nr:PAS domain S-box protein [Candidatus Sumerlaeota bacterium]